MKHPPSRSHLFNLKTLSLCLLGLMTMAPLPARAARSGAIENRTIDPAAFIIMVHQFDQAGSDVVQRTGLLRPDGEFRPLISTRHHADNIPPLLLTKKYWIESSKIDLLQKLLPSIDRVYLVSSQAEECRPLGLFKAITPRNSPPDTQTTRGNSPPRKIVSLPCPTK